MIKSNTKGGLVYGPEAWKIWNVEILDAVQEAPKIDVSVGDKILLYIPQRIRVNGKEQDLTLTALKEISCGPFTYFEEVEHQFVNNNAPGWVIIDSTIQSVSLKDYETQKSILTERGCNMPSVLEALVFKLMYFKFHCEQLF